MAPDSPDQNPSIAIIVSRYHAGVTDALLSGALEAYARRCEGQTRVGVIDAPGAFELPVLAAIAGECGLYDAVVALGCVLKGQTGHNEHIARAVSDSLARIATDTGVPMGFGLLTCDTLEQALARAGGAKGNKGTEAMLAVLDTLDSIRAIVEAIEADDPAGVRRTLVRQIASLGVHEGTRASGQA